MKNLIPKMLPDKGAWCGVLFCILIAKIFSRYMIQKKVSSCSPQRKSHYTVGGKTSETPHKKEVYSIFLNPKAVIYCS